MPGRGKKKKKGGSLPTLAISGRGEKKRGEERGFVALIKRKNSLFLTTRSADNSKKKGRGKIALGQRERRKKGRTNSNASTMKIVEEARKGKTGSCCGS